MTGQARVSKPDRILRAAITRCAVCGKQTYRSRGTAKRALRANHPGQHMRPYRCPAGAGWHIGQLPRRIRAGQPL